MSRLIKLSQETTPIPDDENSWSNMERAHIRKTIAVIKKEHNRLDKESIGNHH